MHVKTTKACTGTIKTEDNKVVRETTRGDQVKHLIDWLISCIHTSHILCSMIGVKAGNPGGPPTISTSMESTLKNGWPASGLSLAMALNIIPTICQRQKQI